MDKFYKIPDTASVLFNNEVELLPSVNEIFELELAYLEFKILKKSDYIRRSAFAMKYLNEFTLHYLKYADIPQNIKDIRSVATNAYFTNGLFSTGYATHSLFPYRGKFHPQLIKAIINIINIKEGETILDPMAGSGTTNIEAALMGINSYAIDISPFCQLMIKTKYDALTINAELLEEININVDELFDFFNKGNILNIINKTSEDKRKIYYLFLLAFLDSLGYSKRVIRSTHRQLFEKVLIRYKETVINIAKDKFYDNKIGKLEILQNSSALDIILEDNSIDGIITSPPYSFAIDYVANDKDQLEYLGCNTESLKNQLVGLKGKTITEKLENYFTDMDRFCQEASRVLKKNKYLVIIIGSNTNQTGGIRLEDKVIESAHSYGLILVKTIIKPIKGMHNTMKEEYILFFEKA